MIASGLLALAYGVWASRDVLAAVCEADLDDAAFPWLAARTVSIDGVTARCLALRFGSRSDVVHELIADHHHLGARIHPQLPFCRAEIVYAVSHEMARTLEDVARRRIPLVLLARVDPDGLTAIAELAGDLLGWSDQRKDEEVWHLVRGLARAPFVRSDPTPSWPGRR